jgi:hypothetical protein
MTRRVALLLGMLVVAPSPLLGQSLFNAAGLGSFSDPLDARTRALGGVGVGLRGSALLGSDPAAAAFYALPSASLTARPSWVEFRRSDGAEQKTFQGTIFPALGIAYPTVHSLVATLTFESFLDQRYEASDSSTIDLGGGPVQVDDQFISRGGVSQLRLGLARRLGSRAAVGVSVARYTGSLTRRLQRTFGAGVDSAAVEAFQTGGFWSYSGAAVTGGASVFLGNVAHLAGSLTWSAPLDATASADTDGASRSYDVPLQLRLGATAVLAPGLSLSAGLTRADWSPVDDDLSSGTSAGATSSYGFGLELSRVTLLGRGAPIRFGYRKADLPFGVGSGKPTETVWAGGVGLNLSQVGDVVRAGVDLALERGDRADSAISEKFWRSTLTVRVSGF